MASKKKLSAVEIEDCQNSRLRRMPDKGNDAYLNKYSSGYLKKKSNQFWFKCMITMI